MPSGIKINDRIKKITDYTTKQNTTNTNNPSKTPTSKTNIPTDSQTGSRKSQKRQLSPTQSTTSKKVKVTLHDNMESDSNNTPSNILVNTLPSESL